MSINMKNILSSSKYL